MFQTMGFLRHFFVTRFALLSIKEYKEKNSAQYCLNYPVSVLRKLDN